MSWLVYGVRPVEALLQSRPREIRQLLISRERGLQEIITEAREHKISLRRIAVDELDAICGDARNHQGVAAIAGEYPFVSFSDLLDRIDPKALVVVVDSVTDPQNLGGIFRSALVLGAMGIVIPKNRSAPVNATTLRVSAGATEHLACAQVTNLARALAELKEAGLWIAGTVEQGGTHPADVDLTTPLALVVGSEGRGIRPLVLKKCDHRLTIPSSGPITSLNVAAATTAVLYEIARQRRSSGNQLK